MTTSTAPLGTSIWMDTVQIPLRPVLSTNPKVDVCVIGAGMAGMNCAYLLAKAGKSVMVLEDGSIGAGMTGVTTAHLTNALDDRYFELERYHGAAGIAHAADSHTAAIERFETIIREENIECDFFRLDGYLFAPPNDESEDLEKEFEALQRAGLHEVEMIDAAPIAGYSTGRALRFPQQAQFHPLKYLNGLASAIERLGGRICCNTHVVEVTGGAEAQVKTREGRIVRCEAIIVATNVPINNRLVIHTKQAPYTTYVVALEVPEGSVVPALYWDTRQTADDNSSHAPYHYVRLLKGATPTGSKRDLLVVGGEDHKTGQPDRSADECFDRLIGWAKERWPDAGSAIYKWSGQVMEPADGMAFIGRNPMDKDDVYVVTGDSGNGMTHGMVAGILLTDLIMGRENPWKELYEPGRVKLKTTPDFIRENANVVGQLASGHLGPADKDDEADIPLGEGAVIRRGLKRIAVYKDDSGQTHAMSAACPHLGCVVAWNGVEKTWDCPCHGSRFDCSGEVINGPANTALEPVPLDAKPSNRPPTEPSRPEQSI